MKAQHIYGILGVLGGIHLLLANPNLDPKIRQVLERFEVKELTALLTALPALV